MRVFGRTARRRYKTSRSDFPRRREAPFANTAPIITRKQSTGAPRCDGKESDAMKSGALNPAGQKAASCTPIPTACWPAAA